MKTFKQKNIVNLNKKSSGSSTKSSRKKRKSYKSNVKSNVDSFGPNLNGERNDHEPDSYQQNVNSFDSNLDDRRNTHEPDSYQQNLSQYQFTATYNMLIFGSSYSFESPHALPMLQAASNGLNETDVLQDQFINGFTF
ncbi:22480_t:CDS:1 [Dentiscutata erythropus]|uniref:22480_t:CDS:1 n=1 Tax=Dentiscutata erythropus TaxID=1348616 RepID=A0A9N9NDI3_9GLOM|nr:22480_t:CDS:1 [Dentiscutata erythropus]